MNYRENTSSGPLVVRLFSTIFYRFDYLLLLFVLSTTALGVVVLAGATREVTPEEGLVTGEEGGVRLEGAEAAEGLPSPEGVAASQVRWWLIAMAGFFVASTVPYRWLRFLGWPLFALVIATLFAVVVVEPGGGGPFRVIKSGGAASWMSVFGLRFQPAELAKITTVIVLAHWLSWRRKRLGNVLEWLPVFALAGLPMFLITQQPDFGTAAIFLPLPLVLLFVAGVPWRAVLIVGAAGLILGGAGFFYVVTADSIPGLSGYKARRIDTFLAPVRGVFRPPAIDDVLHGRSREELEQERAERDRDQDWNIRNAEMALGSGRLFGKGWGKGTLSRLRFVYAQYADFILSALGEQFGLVGCLALLALYLAILWRAAHIAVVSRDPFGRYLVVGLTTVVLVHVFMNAGMSVRLLPVTGIPLPLISYGGTFLVVNYILFGLIANVGLRRDSVETQEGSLFGLDYEVSR